MALDCAALTHDDHPLQVYVADTVTTLKQRAICLEALKLGLT